MPSVAKTCLSLVDEAVYASSAIYRNVDLRSPYRIVVGAHTNINKRCVLDGRGG